VYDTDVDFGDLEVIDPPTLTSDVALPSQKLSPDKLAHLDAQQRSELLYVLDQFPETFSEIPGLCSVVEHRICDVPGPSSYILTYVMCSYNPGGPDPP
jgi:hypothetical protein